MFLDSISHLEACKLQAFLLLLPQMDCSLTNERIPSQKALLPLYFRTTKRPFAAAIFATG